MQYLFSLMMLCNGGNMVVAEAWCKDSEEAIKIFRKHFNFLDYRGYYTFKDSKFGNVSYCVCENWNLTRFHSCT
jgi:hypothetical protein